MATTKKIVKKTVKKTAPRKKVSKKMTRKSFVIQRDNTPFLSFNITEQTVYWLILSLAVLLLGFWVLKIQIDISDLLDTIQASIY